MAEVNTASAPTEQIHKSFTTKESASQGILKGDNGKAYGVFAYKETGPLSKGVSEFLGEMQATEMPQDCSFEATWFTPSEIQNFVDIQQMLLELQHLSQPPQDAEATSPDTPTDSHLPSSTAAGVVPNKTTQHPFSSARSSPAPGQGPRSIHSPLASLPSPHYSSIFSLARAMSPTKPRVETHKDHNRAESRDRSAKNLASFSSTTEPKEMQLPSRKEGRDREKEQGGKKDQQPQDQEKEKERRALPLESLQKGLQHKTAKKLGLEGVQAATPTAKIHKEKSSSLPKFSSPKTASNTSTSSAPRGKTNERLQGVENIYIRFMALMARILGQAEAEAHALYQKIKNRTDDVDTLTHFMSKINSSKGKIDWTNDEEMKQLLAKVRALGVDIPEGKYTWTEDEKKLLKENVQMRKDSLEKITQLERTDMQRYLQEASQCHQARSNVLKLLKEVIDTIIANMRGG